MTTLSLLLGVIVSIFVSVAKKIPVIDIMKDYSKLSVFVIAVLLVLVPAWIYGTLITENIGTLSAEIVLVFSSAIAFYEVITKYFAKTIKIK